MSPAARAALAAAFAASINNEITRRAEQTENEAGAALFDQLELMAERFVNLARPGDTELAARLRTLAQAKDRLRLEELRIAADLSPAETVALITTTGDRVVAMHVLTQYVQRAT